MPAQDGESFLDAAQNARLIASAERYYRIMYYGGAESWNLRDTPHVRDARAPARSDGAAARRRSSGRTTRISATRATPRWARSASELNIGQLCRERFGERGGPDRLRHAYRHGRGGVGLGRADGDQAGAAVAARQLRAALP